MQQENITKKLKLLQHIEPSDRVMDDIEGKIFAKLNAKDKKLFQEYEKDTSFFTSFSKKHSRVWAYIALAPLIVLVILFSFPGFFDKTILSTRIALTQNQYEKARIALSYVKSQGQPFISDSVNEADIKDFSQALAMVDAQMSGLNLVGEEGQYTTNQCKALYRELDTYLGTLEGSIDIALDNDTNKNEIQTLQSQLKLLHKKSEAKLDMYK